MKITKKLMIYSALQLLFCAVAPVVFIFVEYGGKTGGLAYKLPLAAVLVLLVVLTIVKNTLLKARMTKISARITQYETALETETDTAKLTNIENALRKERVTETVLNSIIPMLVLTALYAACVALEKAVLTLSGALGFTVLSYFVGSIFGILAAREVVGKHRGEVQS